MNREKKERKLLLLREKRIRESRKSFWVFCKTLHPDFYKEKYHHLKELCDILQNLIEGNISDEKFNKLQRLIINYPPQHGKSRTLVLFCCWALGINKQNRILTVSYNDNQATEFSRYTRDEIDREKKLFHEIVYNDIFPNSKIKFGNASYKKWALEDEHFSYLGTGLDGSLTGKGFTIRIIDDPIKNADEANNPLIREGIKNWYKGTFLSRRSGDNVIDIINMTRWHKDDLCGHVLNSSTKDLWYVFSKAAINDKGEMLCPELLSKETFEILEKEMDPLILSANYKGITLDSIGKLYNFKTYYDIPRKNNNDADFEKIISFMDTADKGEDYLFCVTAGLKAGFLYVLDMICTQEGQEITQEKIALSITLNNSSLLKIESNFGGETFGRNVEKIVRGKYSNSRLKFEFHHEKENKEARIITNSTTVNNIVLMPHDWDIKYPIAYNILDTYQRLFKANKFHDPADGLTGLVKMVEKLSKGDLSQVKIIQKK